MPTVAPYAAVRVVAYNCVNRPNNVTEEDQFRTVFQAIGNQSVNGISKRLDLLVVSEMDPGSVTRLTTVLNNLDNVNTFTDVLSSSVGGDSTGVIHDFCFIVRKCYKIPCMHAMTFVRNSF